jgi:hypothetical protein
VLRGIVFAVVVAVCVATVVQCRSATDAAPAYREVVLPVVAMPKTPPPAPVAKAPYVAYTDLVAGPTKGGENNKGTYLSIFGVNFGDKGAGKTVKVLINGVEVDNYRYLGPSRGRPEIQQITVQVGAIGNPAPGVPLPIKVVANGIASNTNHTFTVQPGDILFVSTTGNDATAAKNDITRPWRFLQTPSRGGALGEVKAGDVLVLRGGPKVTWSDVGYDNRWLRFRHVTGSAPNGKKGFGYIAVIAYPGEDVHYVPPPKTSGGIHGIGEDYPEDSDWIVISGLRIESASSSQSDGAPVNLQANSDHWRVVNNELGPWPASNDARNKAGGLVGNGIDVAMLGNHIHHIGGGKENHGIYLDSACQRIEIAYNKIHDVTGGNLIQTYDNIGERPLDGILVHNNLIYAGGRYGLNISGGTRSYAAWNNVIHSTALAGVRFAMKGEEKTNIAIVHNTIYGANTISSATNGLIVNDDKITTGAVLIQHNLIVSNPKNHSVAYYIDASNGSAINFRRNLWVGMGRPLGIDRDPVGRDADAREPGFVAASQQDFSVGEKSAAVDAATAKNPFPITDDYRLRPRPAGRAADVGAHEL